MDNHPTLKQQMIRFILTGGISAIVDASFTYGSMLLFAWSTSPAKLLGFILGTLTAYMINRQWTFKAEKDLRRFLLTMLTYILTFFVQLAILRLLFPYSAGFESVTKDNLLTFLFAFVIAQGTATVLNFVIQRWFIFKQ